jgi:hypothetical protein
MRRKRAEAGIPGVESEEPVSEKEPELVAP